jgi:hypothetical protein
MGVLDQPVPRTVHIGKLNMTMPAFLVILFATILFAVTALGAIFARKPMLLLVTIIVYAVAIYTTYVVNCLTVGSCNLLAWILGILYAIGVGLAIIGYVISVFTKGVSITAANYNGMMGRM